MLNLPYSPLRGVRLTDGTCVNALERETDYLLSLEEGRLLAGFYENAGLPTPYVRYGGWEGKLIGGHTLGHYLSAIAHASVNAGIPAEKRERFAARAARIVDALAECAAHSRGEKGFLWGGAPTPAGYAESQFDRVESGHTNIKRDAWVPWYTMHKLLAGLIDVGSLTGYGRATEVACGLGDWVCRRVSRWNDRVKRKVLSVEYGGMNDCLYQLYAITKRTEYARAAHVFDEEPLFDAILGEGENVLDDLHVNTTIPKVVGALNRYLTLHGESLDGEKMDAERYLRVAESFFRIVTERHTYVTGGNSEWERFGADYVLDARRTNCNCETCNVYNMLKLARGLFCATGDKKYADYYDNAFTNSVLSSQNPETGMTTYFQPMASGFFKVFSEPFSRFWCCTGTGMENFSKLGDSVCYAFDGGIAFEQYLSCVYDGGEFAFSMDCDFPLSDRATFRLLRAERPIRVRFRIPDWAADEMRFAVNGARPVCTEESGHVAIVLKEGDTVSFRIPVTVTMKGLPDGGDAFAFLYGGAVLSADFGTDDMRTAETGVDVTIPAGRCDRTDEVYFPDLYALFRAPERFLVREGDEFVLRGGDVSYRFGLHYKRYRERYAIYLRLREGERRAAEPEEAPLDRILAGYGQYEADGLHALSEKNSVSVSDDGSGRYARAGGYFSYDMKAEPGRAHRLRICLRRADNGRPLKITVGDAVVYAAFLRNTMDEKKYVLELPLSAELVGAACREKDAGDGRCAVIPIRFEGMDGRRSATVCDFISIFAERNLDSGLYKSKKE